MVALVVSTYNPEEVIFLLAGILPVSGYTDGTFISIKKDVQTFTSTTSTDGAQSRLYINSSAYTITLVLSNLSSSNDFLTKLHALDQVTQRGKFPLLIKDLNGSSLFVAATCWIEQIPEVTFSNEITSRTWVFRTNQGVLNVGGNEDASSLLEDLINSVVGSLPLAERVVNG